MWREVKFEMKRDHKKSARSRTGGNSPQIKPGKDAKRKLSSAASEAVPGGGGAAGLSPASHDPEHVVHDQDSLTAEMIAARQSNDVATAIDLADRLRRQYPEAESGYQFGAAMLRDCARFDEAVAVQAAAGLRFAERFWLLSEQVLLAQNRGEWQGAVAAAQALRERFPEHFLGWRVGFGALQKLGRSKEADQLLGEAVGCQPAQEWAMVEAIQRALSAGQMQDVARYSETLRMTAPNNAFGWKAGISALRSLDRLSEADEAVKQAGEKFVGEEWILSTAVYIAARRGDWEATRERAAVLRHAFRENEEGWAAGLRSLRLTGRLNEAAALMKDAETEQPNKQWLVTEAAALAQARGNFAEALQLWQHVRERMPDRLEGYFGLLEVNIALGRLQAAEELLRYASPAVADTPWHLAQAAELAHRRGDHEEAALRWSVMLAKFPDSEISYRGSYRGNRALGRLDDADRVLHSALVRFPNARWALTEAAMVAEARFDMPEADRRWESAVAALPDDADTMLKYATARSLRSRTDRRDWQTTVTRLKALREKFPFYVEGWRTHIFVLRSKGESQAAEKLAEECLRLKPDEPTIWLEYALAAGDQGIPERASERLAQAATRFPNSEVIQSGFAQSLLRIGRFDEAEYLYRKGVERFAESADMACGYAASAANRHDWPEALQRWTAARGRFPLDRRASQGLLDAQAATGGGAGDASLPCRTDDAVGQTDRERLYLQFESLGGTGQGCEFGLVQRAAGGVEPLGLLRFSQILPENLVEALECRFEGIGSPEQTVVDFFGTEDFEAGNEPGNPEYRYNDRRFETVMHTYIYKKDMPRDKMFVQTCRRMAFLRRKLIQDLEGGEKVFVYKVFHKNLDDEELARLYRAMRGYGPNTLLYVRYADKKHPSGTVLQVDDGLLIGYISGFSMSFPEGRARAADLPAWTMICKAALALHKNGRQEAELVLET